MKWLLIIVIIFSLLTIFELYNEYKKHNITKKIYHIIATMETVAAIISFVLLFVIQLMCISGIMCICPLAILNRGNQGTTAPPPLWFRLLGAFPAPLDTPFWGGYALSGKTAKEAVYPLAFHRHLDRLEWKAYSACGGVPDLPTREENILVPDFTKPRCYRLRRFMRLI